MAWACDMPCAVSWSKIVPFGGGGSARLARSVEMFPYAVPAMRNRRLGYVWQGAEQNQRLARVNVLASE